MALTLRHPPDGSDLGDERRMLIDPVVELGFADLLSRSEFIKIGQLKFLCLNDKKIAKTQI